MSITKRSCKWFVGAAMTMMVLCAICFVAISCGSTNTSIDPSSPAFAALKYSGAIAKNDIETMGKYATSETIRSTVPHLPQMQLVAKAAGKAQVVSQTMDIDGSKAVVGLKYENNEKVDEIELVNIGGQWRVHWWRNSNSNRRNPIRSNRMVWVI